jgi:predicted TIM-barrel fold metal-dependent hydrolase
VADTGYLKQRDTVTKPKFTPPKGSCDCHSHIIGDPSEFPFVSDRSFTPAEANASQYQSVLTALGMDRAVIVQPSFYGLDNSCTIAAVNSLGKDHCRGVVAISSETELGALRAMSDAGVRAARFITTAKGGASLDQFHEVAKLITPIGWHLEMYTGPDVWRALTPIIEGLSINVVIDHMGKLPANAEPNSEDFRTILNLLDTGRCWIKLCGYRNSLSGHPYGDVTTLARRLIEHAPERCVWGTDWPHTNQKNYMPDDGELLDLLLDWAPDETVRHRILVDNPTQLYGFGG